MKKYLVLILTLALALSVAACGNGGTTGGGAAGGGDSAPDTEVAEPNNGTELGNGAEPAFTLDDLATAHIGVQNGTTGHIFADENFPDAEVAAFPLFADAIMALLAGSLDAVIIDALPGYEFVRENAGRLVILDGQLTAEYYGIAFQHGSHYTALFDDAINQLRANSTFDAIYAYWIYNEPGASRYVSPEGIEHPNGTLLMGTSAGFPPFELWEGGQIVGFDPCLAQAIGDILGYQIEIVDMDFAAIILSVQAGSVDFGMAGMTIRDDRREYVDFSQGYFSSGQRVIVRAP